MVYLACPAKETLDKTLQTAVIVRQGIMIQEIQRVVYHVFINVSNAIKMSLALLAKEILGKSYQTRSLAIVKLATMIQVTQLTVSRVSIGVKVVLTVPSAKLAKVISDKDLHIIAFVKQAFMILAI